MKRTLINMALAAASVWLVSGATAWAQNCQVRTPGLQGSYSGECAGGLANGRGKAQGLDRYEGSFRDGHPNGQGSYTFADGRRFEGEFLDGAVNGRARFFYANGDVLDGVFRNNQLSGAGRMLRRSGEQLVVEIRDGSMVVLASAVAVPAATAAPAAAPALPPPAANPAAAAPAAATAAPSTPLAPSVAPAPAPVAWTPQLDFDDIFPAYLFATASRKPPAAPATAGTAPAPSSRAVVQPVARRDAMDANTPAQWLQRPTPPATAKPAVQSRYIGNKADATYLGDPWGLVGIRLRNTKPGAVVQLRVAIDDLAEPTDTSFTLPTAGEYALYPKMRWRWERLRTLQQSAPVNVSWTVAIDGQPQGTQVVVAQVRPLQDAPHTVITPQGPERLLWVFAGFVTEEAPWIDELIRDAFTGSASGALGYQVDAAGVDKQVAAVYALLQKRGVKYSSISKSVGGAQRVFSQTVRFPSDSIRTAQANCVDGTVLMASILRKMGVEPIIVTGPGHALLGYYRLRPGSTDKPDIAFVETTMIGSAPFAAATQQGMAQVGEWIDKHNDDPSFQLFPVWRYRAAGVMPIPR